jgi:16S rRNA (cytosine967-C5)-methyltransferase
MTPGARIAAAIGILDAVLAGQAAEATLTQWARASRFAGSGDRLAVRDLVFAALRQRRSLAWMGAGDSGRGLMIGLARQQGQDLNALFSGIGHAPEPISGKEAGLALADAPEAVRADLPDWLWARFQEDLGPRAMDVAQALRDRAPVFVRVNTARGDRASAQAALAADGITTVPHPEVATALCVVAGERRIAQSTPYLEGRVELQDAASQAAVLALPLSPGEQVLDYCAGGGGKALAMAVAANVTAHDAAPRRMADLPARAARAGVAIEQVQTADLENRSPFQGVLVDAPCSGSGTWRRTPEARWRLTPERLADLARLQGDILVSAARHVAPGGWLAYATCSVLTAESDAIIKRCAPHLQQFEVLARHQWWPGDAGDGFFLVTLRRSNN